MNQAREYRERELRHQYEADMGQKQHGDEIKLTGLNLGSGQGGQHRAFLQRGLDGRCMVM
jgi:hypothetical protein